MDDLSAITGAMREFTRAREWERFHDPKSLTLALVGEVGELAELLQWVPSSTQFEAVAQEPLHARLGEEMSDVLLYLVRLSDVCGIDLPSAVARKLELNASKHPLPQDP